MTFDGSAIEGYSRIQESDMLARPDPNTFELLPGRRRRRAGRPDVLRHPELLGRAVRRRPPLRAEAQPRAGAREGLHVLRRPRDGVLLLPRPTRASSRSTPPATSTSPPHDLGSQLRKQTVLRLEAMGIPVEYSFHENGPSQHEIDLRYTDALDDGRQRDDVPARRQGGRRRTSACYATFMPKPIAGAFGSGMHTHLSLFEGDVNAFHDPGDEYGLSKVAQALHRRAARARERDHRDHQPVGQLLQAADPRLRSAGVQVLGAQQPVGARARAAAEEGQERARPASSSARPTRRATRTSRSR